MYGLAPALEAGSAPLDRLEACHRRIEAHLALLERLVSDLRQHGCDGEAREAARFALRFFDSACAEHHRDEEEDLFPLLRRRAAELGCAEVSAVINELAGDHATMATQWSRLRRRLEALANGADELLASDDIAGFTWLYRRHLEKESALILPFAREVLGAAECAAFGERMAARRAAHV